MDDQQKNELGKLGIGYTEEMYYCTMLVSFHAIRDFSDFEKITEDRNADDGDRGKSDEPLQRWTTRCLRSRMPNRQ